MRQRGGRRGGYARQYAFCRRAARAMSSTQSVASQPPSAIGHRRPPCPFVVYYSRHPLFQNVSAKVQVCVCAATAKRVRQRGACSAVRAVCGSAGVRAVRQCRSHHICQPPAHPYDTMLVFSMAIRMSYRRGCCYIRDRVAMSCHTCGAVRKMFWRQMVVTKRPPVPPRGAPPLGACRLEGQPPPMCGKSSIAAERVSLRTDPVVRTCAVPERRHGYAGIRVPTLLPSCVSPLLSRAFIT